MSSVSPVSASPGFRTWPQHEPYSLVTITAVQTETVRPTWIFTLTAADVGTSTVTSETLSTQSSTIFATVLTQLSTTDAATPNTSSATTSGTLAPSLSPKTPLSSPMENLPDSTPIASLNPGASSGMHIAPTPSTSSDTSRLFPSSVASASTSSSASPTIATTTSSTFKTTTSPLIGIVTSASTSSASTDSTSALSAASKTGIIVGSIIGGCAVLIALVAIAFCIRRNRSPERGPKQHLLRNSISSTRHSTPSLPGNMSFTPTLPTIRPVLAAYSNPDLSLDSMYLRRERFLRNFSEASIQPSSVDISPSRMASFYSTSSWDGGLGLQEYWDLECGDLTKHDSMRSNPFDLEPPPSVHRPPVPAPTPWGIKF